MSSDDTLNCVLCKEAFTDKETLQEHFRKHGDRNFNQSTKQHKQKNEGENSDKTNVGNEVVQCDVCEEVFPTISKAITHKHKAHPDHNTKYFCSWCGKLFTMKHLYNKHYINHENMERGEDVFHCDHCDVDFYKVSAMLYHNNSVHRDFEMPDIGHSRKQKLINQDLVTIYYCPFCGEENINKVNVNKHISDDHSGEDQSPDEVLRCPLCDAIFYHLDAYEAHLTYHSPDDIYNGVENNSQEASMSEYSLDTVPPVVEKVEDVDEATDTLENLLEMADEDTSERKKHKKKHKKHKKSKKETITLDEFLSMSDVLGGEGLDIHGIELVPTQSLTKTFKTKPRPQLPKVNKKPMSQIDKLKQQGIIVKKSNSKGNLPRPVSKVAPQAKVTQNSSTEVISKLLNQSGSQLVISKKPVMVAKTIQDTHKDLSSPDLINKSHESLEVECDLPPGFSSDIDQNDAVSVTSNKEKGDENRLDVVASDTTAVETNATEKDKPEEKNSVQEETKKSSIDILKGLSHLITVKSVSKPDKTLEKDKEENLIQDNTSSVPDTENSKSTVVNEHNPEIEAVAKKTEESPKISSAKEELGALKNVDSKSVFHKVSQQITVKPVAKPKINQETRTEDTIDKNDIDEIPNAIAEPNFVLVNKTPKETTQNDLQSPSNKESNIENKKPANHLDILKGLGQNIVIKSSPKQCNSAANTSNNVSMLDEDIETNIPESVIAKKPTTIENKPSTENNNKIQQPTNSNSSIPDVIKNMCRSITIKSNKSQNPIIQQSTHDDIKNSDVEENSENDNNIEDATGPKTNSGLNITKQSSSPQPSGLANNDQKLVNTIKTIGQNITVKPPSLIKSQNTDIGSIQPNSAVGKKYAAPKHEVVPNKNMEVFKNLSKHITVKSSKPLATSSENEDDYQTDEEEHNLVPSKTTDLEDTRSRTLTQNHNIKNQVVLQNISHVLTIKQSSPKSQNTIDAKLVNKPNKVNRPFSTNNKILDKSICKNTEIFSIDDSDSDDIDAKNSTNLPKGKNNDPKVDVTGSRTIQAQAVPPPDAFKSKNVSVKPVIKTEEDNSKALVPVSTGNEHDDDEFFDSDFDESELVENPNNSKVCETQKFLMNNKNITIKSSNSSQTRIVKNVSQKMVKVAEKAVTNMDNKLSEDEDNLDFPTDNEVEEPNHKQTPQKVKNKSNFGKESVVDSFKGFDSDSDGFAHEDEAAEAPEDDSNSLINKLKNINKSLSIKSNNPTIPSTSKKNIEHNVMKRSLAHDSNSQSNTAPKQTRVENINKVENNKQTNQAIQVTNNQMRTVNHQASTSSTNKVQQKVTTSVRRIETETVVEEITTTVTRTIKTVNQTVNKQVTMSGSQTNVVSEPPLRFASPNMISGPRSQQLRSIQGTRVRAPAPDNVRPRMRPTRPVLANNIRLPTPPQRMPSAPRVRLNAPTPNVAPVNPGPSNQPRGPRPLRVSPKVMGQLNRANQSFSNDDNKPGHFSCFRKPKEAITPLNEIPDCLPAGFSSVVQESNFSNKKTIVKSDGAGTSQMRSEVSTSAQQQIKKCNMAGVKVAKRSMVQQVCTMEQREVSSANRSTMDAIERLQRSGLLVKKPRIEEVEEPMNDNSDDEAPHGGPLLAIEDGT